VGLNSVAMNSFRFLPAAMLFPAVLCVCSFAVPRKIRKAEANDSISVTASMSE